MSQNYTINDYTIHARLATSGKWVVSIPDLGMYAEGDTLEAAHVNLSDTFTRLAEHAEDAGFDFPVAAPAESADRSDRADIKQFSIRALIVAALSVLVLWAGLAILDNRLTTHAERVDGYVAVMSEKVVPESAVSMVLAIRDRLNEVPVERREELKQAVGEIWQVLQDVSPLTEQDNKESYEKQ